MDKKRSGALIMNIPAIEIPSGRVRMSRDPAGETVRHAIIGIHDHCVERRSRALRDQSDPSLHPFVVPLFGERRRDGEVGPADDFEPWVAKGHLRRLVADQYRAKFI